MRYPEALNAGQRAAKNVKVATSKKFQDAQHAGENLRQKVSGSVNDLEDEAAIDVIKSTQKQGENLKHQATDVRDKVKTAAKSEKAHAEGLLHKVYNVLTDINDSIITYSRQKTIKDTVIDTVSASAKSGAKLATDAAKTTGDYVVDAAVSAAKVNQAVVASAAKGKILEATDILKQKATKAAKVGSEYAEIFGEKVDTATETDSEYLTQGTETVKEYPTKASKEIAKEKLDEVATEINASAKEFAADAVKTTGEHATQASERLHEKVPEAIAAGKKFAAKAVKIGHKYGKEALEQTEIYARQVYEAGKEKAGELLKDAK
ncbi:unnamed protein product [Rotaria magnacalcarata]|uniref:Uncharacterized protein n=1 Tax=Rotaria magnacalcarata TaxID=392030 RepID=A0A816NN08_9BILA|nr:unnamed protein product [Rotaria magnacalcarata]